MEKRREKLNTKKQCRFCLSDDESIRSLYDRNRASNTVPLSLKIMSCISVEVFPSDKMPHYICDRCRYFMDISYEFKHICRQADETILQFVQTGTPLEPVTWPPKLTKLFHYGSKSSRDVGIKTVVEGGATVEVTSQDNSDSDDDEENVYNVKIEEGSDGGSSACIKVVTSKESQDVTKEKPKQADKGFSSVSKLARHVRSHAGERAYPCKYCDKSFIKSHHYTRHLKLKHIESMRAAAFGMPDQYRCEQCEDSFGTQDELIYHSAIHATQNLTCPLCQEKFENVDDVTSHIKSHVNGTEFMCDLCELVFTSKEKLDGHVLIAHDDELRQVQGLGDDSSMDTEWKGDDDDDTMNVREEDDQMVVEIKKAEEFMLTSRHEEAEPYADEKIDNTNSEESEVETTYTELSTVDTLNIVKKEPVASPIKTSVAATLTPTVVKPPAPALATLTTITPKSTTKVEKSISNQTAGILRRAEEIKRKTIQTPPAEIIISDKKEKVIKVETSNSVGASDKSLRLLEKELQELKRTTRNEVSKTPAKPVESLRSNRRPQLHTSTPKLRATEEKKSLAMTKSPALEKKLPERRAVKENKEPKEGKSNNTSLKEDKETKLSANAREEKEKEIKERDTPKTIVKNGGNDKSVTDDSVRRSTRPSKIKDYAKMIRDRSQMSDDDTDDGDDEEYVDSEKNPEIRSRARRVSNVKPTPPKTVVKPTPTRKRGRPRKDQSIDVPAKLKKDEIEDEEEAKSEKMEAEESSSKGKEKPVADETDDSVTADESSNMDISKPATADPVQSGIMVSPTGQTLKKVPIKNLPPGVKPLPLPRPISGPGELCEMQIGKKVVKVQKIVMTKAEVEAMAKKGLVEMKDGTMVLKQGIKIPKSDPVAIKSTLVGEAEGVKESPSKKGAPSRCDLGEDA